MFVCVQLQHILIQGEDNYVLCDSGECCMDAKLSICSATLADSDILCGSGTCSLCFAAVLHIDACSNTTDMSCDSKDMFHARDVVHLSCNSGTC